jgi:MSHA biogenesis protein MshJ
MNLKSLWRGTQESFDDRAPAEKMLIGAILLGALGWLYVMLAYDPLSERAVAAERQLATVQARLDAMRQREQMAITAGNEDPNQAVRLRIERATADQRQLQGQIEELAGNLVTPQSMTRLLTSMLEERAGLRLIRVENQLPEPMRDAPGAGQSTQQDASDIVAADNQQVYKHSLLLELEGDYLSLISYLRRVESFAESFFWDEIHFVQTEWPNARITLQLHTLSAEEGFVGV